MKKSFINFICQQPDINIGQNYFNTSDSHSSVILLLIHST